MICILDPVTQLVARPIADPGVVSLILAQSHTFVEIDHEIFSTVNSSVADPRRVGFSYM